MSTHTRLKALEAEAAKKKPAKKKTAKRDVNGRYVKKEIVTPGEENVCIIKTTSPNRIKK